MNDQWVNAHEKYPPKADEKTKTYWIAYQLELTGDKWHIADKIHRVTIVLMEKIPSYLNLHWMPYIPPQPPEPPKE